MADMNAETTHCSNCKKDIARGNFVMHEMHCRRHIVLCEHCKEPVPKTELEQHFNDLHAKVSCAVCGEKVEKNKLEHHMDRTCSKKPTQCAYCELECPQSELDSHLNYCGTRTEQCHLCDQFIMLKDQLQHETSGCQYPVAKPVQNGHSVPRNDHAFLGDFQYSDTFHPFALGEIGRILEQTSVASRENRRDRTGGNTRNTSTGQPQMQWSSQPVGRMRNDTSVGKSTTNRKSELNKKKEKVTERHVASDDDDDVDRLLALQLAQDLDSGDDLNQLIQNFEKQPVPTSMFPSSAIPPDLNRYPEDDELMPCEFCGEPFSAEMLVQHQSGCDPQLSGAWLDVSPRSDGRNNESAVTSHHTVAHIPVINNLERETEPDEIEIPVLHEWRSPEEHVYIDSDEEDDVMLPCEFCSDLFPVDFLVQHQAVCDANVTMTPRATTPAAKVRNVLSRNTESDTNSPSHRHQESPDIQDLMRQFADPQEESHNYYTPGFNDTRPEVLTPASSRPSSKYGVPSDRYDEYLTRPSRTDLRDRDHLRSNVHISERAPHLSPSKKDSSARTRSTLASLLQGDTSPELDYLAAVNTSQTKALKNEDNLEKRRNVTKGSKKVTSNESNLPQVSATRLHTQSDQRSNPVNPRSRGNRQRARQTNGSLVEQPSFQVRPVAHGRQRTGNQIFNPSARGSTPQKSPYSTRDQEN